MNNMSMKSFYIGCHILTEFFTSYENWNNEKEILGMSYDMTLKQYNSYLRGTRPDILIPVWASTCKNSGFTLLNDVTLEVIKFYKKYGYNAVSMEGNPVDYIGEQFRFLEYLSSLTLRNIEDYSDVINHFIQEFTIDTVHGMITKTSEYKCNHGFIDVLNDMKELLKTGNLKVPSKEIDITQFDSYLWHKNSAIFVNSPEYVCSAGLNNCGGKCRINLSIQEGCILSLDTDNRVDEKPQIRSCVRGKGYRKTFLNASRLRYPMKRVGERGGGEFKRVSWDEAIDIFTSEMKRIKEAYGPASRFPIYATGVTGIMCPQDLAKSLMALDGGYLDSYNTYSSACASYVIPYVYGDRYVANPIHDVLNTKLLLLWGHNPSETIFGSYTNYYISQLRDKGAKIVVIDPRESDSAIGYADEWIGIRPSTDGAMMDAMAYVILKEKLQDQVFMDAYCIGFDENHMPEGVPVEENYRDYLFGKKDGVEKTPYWAEEICGVPAEIIESLAKEYATTKPACILPGLGPQRTGNGEQTYRGFAMLCCIVGSIGVSGGSTGGFGGMPACNRPGIVDIPNPYPGLIPTFLWTKAIEKGTELKPIEDGLKGVSHLDSNIKMIINLAGNTLINQHSNINDTIRILKDTSKCEFIVTSDIFMTASARYSDLVLPATSLFEGNNISLPWGNDSYFLYNSKVTEPLFESRFEYDWLKEAARKMGVFEEFVQGNETTDDWLRHSYEETKLLEKELPPYEEFKKLGGYQYKNAIIPLSFKKQIKDKKPFNTPSGRIEIFSKALYDMNQHDRIPGIPCYTPCEEGPSDPKTDKYPLQLIGYHSKRRCHSIHDNNEWMEEIDPPALWIHPKDAEVRAISEGEMVDIFNDRGCVRISAKITGRIIKGVVALSQGGWYTPNNDGIDMRGSINVLTHTIPTPLAKGNPQHSNLVEVLKTGMKSTL